MDGGFDSSVRRTSNGAIDVGYYERCAVRLRSRFMRTWIQNCFASIFRLWCKRKTEHELRALDERSLHDMGVSACDIPAIVDGSFSTDTSRRMRGTQVFDSDAKN